MIEITENKSEIIIEGHAYYDEPGKDIICAAISALAFTLIDSLRELTKYNAEPEICEGYMKIKKTHSILFDAFFIGTESIANQYPEYIKIERNLNS